MYKIGIILSFLLAPFLCKAYAPFSILSGAPDTKSRILFNQIPPFWTQDGLGNCPSAAAAAYLDMMNCKAENKDPNVNTCEELSEADAFSRLATGKFAGITKDGTTEKDYSGILPKIGANPTNILKNIIYDGLCAPTQQCASLDKALVNFTDADSYTQAKKAIFDKLQKKHADLKKDCESCAITLTGQDSQEIENLTKSLDLKQPNVDVLKAFSELTYSQFLEKILMPQSCDSLKLSRCYDGNPNVSIEQFPKNKLEINKSSREILMGKIKNKLSNNTPVILNNICTKKNGKCTDNNDPDLHTLIITGYQKICGSNGCRDSLRVFNSNGAKWQEIYGKGWLDAEGLLDSTDYAAGALTWVEEKKGKTSASNKKQSTDIL